jgi:hypothetical protein
MEFELAVVRAVAEGGGEAAAVIYTVHLLAEVMRDPERVGAWLPRVLAAWHIGMTKAEKARHQREEAKQANSAEACCWNSQGAPSR